MAKGAETREMKDNIREYLIREMQTSSSIQNFDLSETLLVMYDTGVVKAIEGSNGEPVFSLNDDATEEQHNMAEKVYQAIHGASNDVWNHYVFGSAC